MRAKALSGSIAKYSRGLALSVLTLIGVSQAPGAIYYWDNSGGTANDWGSVANWSTVIGGGTDPGAIPGVGDVATFSATPIEGTPQTVNLNDNRSVLGLEFLSGVTATTTLLGGGTDRTLTIGASGITSAASNTVTIGSSTAGQNVNISVAGSQSWAINGTRNVLIVNSVSGTGSPTLTNNGTGSGIMVLSGFLDSSVTRIVQDSATSQLNLRNGNSVNTFAGIVEIKKGTVSIGNGATNLGTGVGGNKVIFGNSAGGSNAATLTVGDNNNQSFATPIELAANTTGLLTIRLEEDSTSTANSKTFTGGITGNNSLTIENNGGTGTFADTINFTTNQLNFTGSLTHIGTGTGDSTISSVIGPLVTGVTQNSATSRMVLSGANTYTGVTTVNVGTLKLNRTAADNTTILTDNNTATTSDIVINGGTLELAASEQIANTGSINMTSGAFNFGAATGKTETIDKFTNSGGTFTTGANILIGLGNTVTWSGTSTNTVSNGGAVQDLHIVISGGTNTVEGGATGGVLQLNSGGLGLEMSAGATLTLNSATAPAVAGKLLLSGNVSTSGETTVTIANGGSGDNPGNIDLNNGTRTFTVADGAAATDMSISAVITNTGSIIKDGAGTLSLDAANTYSGTTTITNGGTLIANVLGALPLSPRSAVSFTGTGTSALNLGANQFVASLSSAVAATVALGSNTLTVGIAGGNTTFAGSINGTGGNLVKDTNSTQVLSGANGYTGTTTVSAGTLEVQGSLIGTTAVTVSTGGTLLLNANASNVVNSAASLAVSGTARVGGVQLGSTMSGKTQTFASLTLSGDTTLDFGAGAAGNAFLIAGSSSFSGNLQIWNWTGSVYSPSGTDTGTIGDGQDRLLFTTASGFNLSNIKFFSDNGNTRVGFGPAAEISFSGGGFEIVPVPEPATTALIGSIALCALIAYRERRRFTGLGKRMAARK
jgi:autotransporter-associated beta strand protein